MSERLTLTELQLMIRDSLYISFPEMYWVSAEISEIKENHAGHCYLELIEKQSDGRNIQARIKAIIWCKRFGFLGSYFENVTGERLREGIKVLVKVKIEYHELYGLSLIICDIDPAFTLGELALKRQMIIRKLEEEGIFDMNRELGLPLLLQRIAVVSSASAAGYTDFINHLTGNEARFVFYTKLFESPMQGTETEQGIISALDRIAMHQDLFDAVVIIRGGGSQVDLSWFDNYNIAYHITQFPLPVITGIGHEKDLSVTDMVACIALKTPTAVADFIVMHASALERKMQELHGRISEITRVIIEANSRILENSVVKLAPMSRILLASMKERLSGKSIRLVRTGGEYIRKAVLIPSSMESRLSSGIKSYLQGRNIFLENSLNIVRSETGKIIHDSQTSLAAFEKSITLLKPENVLRRGFTITRHNGVIKKEASGLQYGNILETQFIDGTVSSRIIEDLSTEQKQKHE